MVSLAQKYFNIKNVMNDAIVIVVICTVLPEIFARVLFSLISAVGVGPRKLSVRNFLRARFGVY